VARTRRRTTPDGASRASIHGLRAQRVGETIVRKRLFDLVFSSLVLVATGPLLLVLMFLVWRQDRHHPLYKAPRVGRGGREFTMMKIRSMIVNADKSGVNSTSSGDRRITPLGHFIRRWKIDELSQFLNVWKGDMSVVGPRPNTRAWGVDLYTPEEMRLLDMKPGITDLSSIVFSDEGAILAGAEHADLRYNQVIRPWKSRLGLLYGQHASVGLDLRIVWLTVLAVTDKPRALQGVVRILQELGADPTLIEVCRRQGPVPAGAPPGADSVFQLEDAVGAHG
jgi:lipopolysaccharide/colanic/teichoic acid biosynthesis glycosyltransferase